MERASEAVRARIDAAPLDAVLADAVAGAYERLCRRCGMDDCPGGRALLGHPRGLAGVSAAGGHDTFLCVRGSDEVARHGLRCWSSLWTTRPSSTGPAWDSETPSGANERGRAAHVPALFVDDQPRNVAGAESAGLHALHFRVTDVGASVARIRAHLGLTA